MFRTFEKLVDPFAPFEEKTPPSGYLAYLKSQMAPFRKWIPWMMITGLIVAVMESGLIFYSGRIVDLIRIRFVGGLISICLANPVRFSRTTLPVVCPTVSCSWVARSRTAFTWRSRAFGISLSM